MNCFQTLLSIASCGPTTCRDFENECNQAYMAGKIRGFMHLDNGKTVQVDPRLTPG